MRRGFDPRRRHQKKGNLQPIEVAGFSLYINGLRDGEHRKNTFKKERFLSNLKVFFLFIAYGNAYAKKADTALRALLSSERARRM